jgi:hypothetical protein
MRKIKGPKVHALTVQDDIGHQNHKSKDKDKRKTHANPKKEGYSKPFNDASVDTERGVNQYQVQFENVFNLYFNQIIYSIISNEQ